MTIVVREFEGPRGVRDGGELERFEAIRHRAIAGCSDPLGGQPQTVLVTGGTGCIGTTLLEMLGRTGPYRLLSLARRPPAPGRRLPGVTYLRGDVRRAADVRRALASERVDLVAHLAAQRDPGLAERRVYETVSTNLFGTGVVLGVSGECGVPSVVIASTGKALRYYTSDVYAATKALLEYRASRAAERWGYHVACARFTHVVDNSLIYEKLSRWTSCGCDVTLHGPEVFFHAQSALECAELLLTGARLDPGGVCGSGLVALRDLGWPPIDLLQMARDMIARNASTSRITFTGFGPGYEEEQFVGTYNPATAGEHSPLLNALEADLASGVDPNPSVVEGLTVSERSDELDHLLDELDELVRTPAHRCQVTSRLREASLELLAVRLSAGRGSTLDQISAISAAREQTCPDHVVIAERLALLAAGKVSGGLSASGSRG